MLAHAILAMIAARGRTRTRPSDQKLIPLTVNEIRRLFAKRFAATPHTITHWLAGPAGAAYTKGPRQTSHYRRRGQLADRPAPA
ncbi:hypothetical protein [Phytohabitans kaempferiae]|uniref:Uncharacterized protein n=1 Tax=Phytohabitans kaempferiae TaxID=1620943 RepID=A0ABV6MF27_9ACTN